MANAALSNIDPTNIDPNLPPWPELDFAAWQDTCATLHMWTQIVGKIRMVQSPWVNHAWHVVLYVTARGLTTSPIAYGARMFQIDFDFHKHALLIETGDGALKTMALQPRSVADFYHDLLAQLSALGLDVAIHPIPNEVVEAIPFGEDVRHAAYDAAYAHRFWRALSHAHRVFSEFRSGFIGKCSPVHFFWGSFDLAVTRFSGRTAPEHPGGIPNCPDWVTRDAYSHEVCSCGFWPGGEQLPYPVFYCYAYPEAPGMRGAPVGPGARYDDGLREFILPYETVRRAPSPDAVLLEFLHSSYAAAANAGGWDRAALERGAPPRAR